MNIIKKIGAALIVALLVCVNSTIVQAEVNGVDISNYQNDINFSQESNIKYVYVMATQGTTFSNWKMNSQYNSAANKHRGFYHFMNNTDPIQQARHFYDIIKNYNYDCKPMLDIELTYGMQADTISYRIEQFCNEFKRLSGQSPILYTGSYFQRFSINSRVQQEYEYWIASYYIDIGNVLVAPGTKMIAHQNTDRYLLQGQYVDGDYFTDSVLINGSNNVLNATITNNVGINNNYINIAKNYLGSNAKRTQYLLNAVGYNLTTDGVVGQLTATAIGNFQNGNNLAKDYMFGNQCKNAAYNKLNNKVCGIKYTTPVQTKYIQYILKQKGFYKGNIDGVYWKGTEQAVRKFQAYYGLAIDGVVGSQSWYYLIM